MTSMKIGILPQDQMRERVLKIARGELKPKPGDPKVWFPSIRSLAEVLSDDNRELLKLIAKSALSRLQCSRPSLDANPATYQEH